MPTYEYRCGKCGNFEITQRISEGALSKCPTCGEDVQRLLSAAPFHLKGGGWYKTDYAKSGSSGTSSGGSTSAPSASTSTGEVSGTRTESDGKGVSGTSDAKKETKEKSTESPAATPSTSTNKS